jgi:hypothetical protein
MVHLLQVVLRVIPGKQVRCLLVGLQSLSPEGGALK